MITVNPMQSYTVREVADLLGVSRSTVYTLIRTGELPAYRVRSRSVRIRYDALDRYIQLQEKGIQI